VKKIGFTIVFLAALILAAACGGTTVTEPTVQPAATEQPATAEVAPTVAPADTTMPETAEATCPEATADTYLLRNPQHGYCLLYPAGHKVERPSDSEVALVVGSLLNVTEPRVGIQVIPTEGRAAAAYADEIVAGFEGFAIARSETTVAGEPAVVLDDVPGQDINRQVIFSHDDRLFHLYFSPIDPANPAVMDAFTAGILESLTFIPVSETVTTADECVAPKEGEQQILNEALGICFLAPADFTFEQPSETNGNLFAGSIMDVTRPKLMIEVSHAGGQTATAAADALMVEFEGLGVTRTFGDTLGYEPADRLDGVPGQDLGRVLLAVHDGRLYRLTFVPNDPSQGDVYNQMEALFNQVLATFRFLP
jgi:hypothetical protein